MPNPEAATWSAVAAIFSAISSFLVMLIQRRNLLESVRPELVLVGWSRETRGEGESAHEVISFKTVRNVGRGAALNVFVNASRIKDNRPEAFLATIRVPILAVNEENDVNGEITVWWKNVKPDAQGNKFLPITITIWYWDSRSMRHEKTYCLFAVELNSRVGVSDDIAPGVMLGQRKTKTEPVWLLRLTTRIGQCTAWLRWRTGRARQAPEEREGAVT